MPCLPTCPNAAAAIADRLEEFVERLQRVEELLRLFSAQLEGLFQEDECIDDEQQQYPQQDGWQEEACDEGNI